MPYVTRFDQQDENPNIEHDLREVLYATNRLLSTLRADYDQISEMSVGGFRSELIKANDEKQAAVTNFRNQIWTHGECWFGWQD